jgi:hypothetical protein
MCWNFRIACQIASTTMTTCKHYSSTPTEQQTRWWLHDTQSRDKPPEPKNKPLERAKKQLNQLNN